MRKTEHKKCSCRYEAEFSFTESVNKNDEALHFVMPAYRLFSCHFQDSNCEVWVLVAAIGCNGGEFWLRGRLGGVTLKSPSAGLKPIPPTPAHLHRCSRLDSSGPTGHHLQQADAAFQKHWSHCHAEQEEWRGCQGWGGPGGYSSPDLSSGGPVFGNVNRLQHKELAIGGQQIVKGKLIGSYSFLFNTIHVRTRDMATLYLCHLLTYPRLF